MISFERRPFYNSFIQKTGEIAAKFVSTDPKPRSQAAGSLLESIYKVDQLIGSSLLMMDPKNLFVQVIALERGNHSVADLVEHDPLTRGLINGEPVTKTETSVLYKTTFEELSMLVSNTKKSADGSNVDLLTATLIGSDILASGEIRLDNSNTIKI
ncbi:MAG: hypothetical protein AAB441_02005 [Patescibacteria group bacterium]